MLFYIELHVLISKTIYKPACTKSELNKQYSFFRIYNITI